MKHRSAIITFLVLALLTVACGGGTTTTTTPPADTQPAATQSPVTDTPPVTEPPSSVVTEVIIGLQLEPPTLDLTSSPAAAIPQVLLYNVYEGLVKLESDGSISPLLAESWDLSDDGTEYAFHLRQGVVFHNGEPLTAADVVFSLNNVLTKDPAHPFANTLAPIESVEAVDDNTVKVTLSQFSANLLFFLTQGQGVILKESAIADIATNPVGTGPFGFVEHAVGDSIVIEQNDSYWGDPPPMKKITYRYINDPNALNNALLAGDIDIIAGVSAPELLEAFQGDDRFNVLTGLTNGQVTLAINANKPPLDNLLVRQAITHAISSQAVVDGAYFGYGELIGTHATPLDPYYVDLNDAYPYDPQKAMELLAEADVSDLTLTLYLPPVSYARRGGEIVASQLGEVGISVDIQNVEWGVWLEDVFSNDDYHLSIVAHVEPRDLVQYGNPDYYWAYDNPEVADLLAQADAEPDDATRYDLYGQVQRQITADAANVWIFLLPALSVTKAGISGYTPDAPGLSLDLTSLAFNP